MMRTLAQPLANLDMVDAPDVVRVCGIPVSNCPHRQVLDEIGHHIDMKGKSRHVSITNTESMYFACRLPEHRTFIENAYFSLCDGVGVVLGARAQRKQVRRYNGPVLMEECCRYGVEQGWRHFFLGGKEGVADLLAETLKQRCPGLIVAGTYCPPFRALTAQEEEDMVRRVNESRPDILWVGLGLLKQEAFIARYKGRLQVPWQIGVGAAFDYHAGTAHWAPPWIQRLGLEWLYRLGHEPRMLVRNWRSFLFLLEAVARPRP